MTPDERASRPVRRVASLLAALASVALLAALPAALAQGGGKPKPVTGGKGDAAVRKGSWKTVDRLVDEQKLEEARAEVEKIRRTARAAGDEHEWAKALAKEVQLRMALHGYETAVRFLADEPWPQGVLDRSAIRLFYADALVTYTRAYSWEIGQRERVESKEKVDLKAWTREQIHAEARRVTLEVWRDREGLGAEPVKRLADYLEPNSFPPDVRPTLRDAVSYLFASLLADSSGWTPEQSNDLFRVDLTRLLGSPSGELAGARLDDPATHPVVKAAAVLADLEGWHASRRERPAELEAFLERARVLSAAFTKPADRKAVSEALEARLPAFRDVSWWATGQAELAELARQDGRPGNLVKARRLAEEGRKAYPSSPGGERCRSVVASIEAPEYQVAAMASDGIARRSIEIRHRNLPSVWFRAYPLDLEARVASAQDWNLLPGQREVDALLSSGSPVAEWKVDLPATPDFKTHKTYAVPPMRKAGAYVVVASRRPDFGTGSSNQVYGLNVVLSDLVLVTRPDDEGGFFVTATAGSTGRPVPGVKVSLWEFDWRQKHRRARSETTGASGEARFGMEEARSGKSHFLVARKGEEVAVDSHYLSFSRPQEPGETSSALVYTDRSVYRPDQKVLWKVVAYRGTARDARFRVSPQTSLSVWLVDPNGERVASADVVTNAWGSAAGEFTVPRGRLLGAWRVEASTGGAASVRVEEYKRPTFEAAFKAPAAPLRINRPAILVGEARYYFGLPVTSGLVRWRVTREPVFPWWWGLWGHGPRSSAQTVATGTAPLREDGTFEVAFTPEADERQDGATREMTWRYAVSADVTDEGGETRSAVRSVRLGLVSVEARLEPSAGFFLEGRPAEAKVTRTSLDGTPRPGKGTFRLVRLAQPGETPLPSEVPLPKGIAAGGEEGGDEPEGDFETPGDRLRPRWQGLVTTEAILREWADGAVVRSGELSHGEDGQATAALGSLPPGAYRLRYETVDDFGETYETARELLVGGRSLDLKVPLLLAAESTSVEVGGTARLLVHSGLAEQPLTLDVYRAGRLASRRTIEPGRDPALVEIPVGEGDRGGFGVALTGVRDHQLMRHAVSVFVPWDDRQLKLEFATFRDRIRPGTEETWRVTVKGPDGKAVSAGAAELLGYMYDRSLDVFAPHLPPSPLSLYPWRAGTGWLRASLGAASAFWVKGRGEDLPGYPTFLPDRLKGLDGYAIGGPGYRGRMMMKSAGAMPPESAPPPAPAAAPARQAADALAVSAEAKEEAPAEQRRENEADRGGAEAPAEAQPLRSDFSETAFFRPQLLTGPDGSVAIEFKVPDSVTSWNVWVHAVTKDLRGGSLHEESRSVKELMVRPYVPRFLREGDEAQVKVVVNNASDADLAGKLRFDVIDPETNESLAREFGLTEAALTRDFVSPKGGGTNLTFAVVAPKRVGTVAFKVVATAGDLADGELRPLPVLPGRMHLVQSRFVTLRGKDARTMHFADLEKDDDPTRVDEQMVVTVDAQLFYTVLQALPYLVNYPYECTEQTLNRFVSTGIVSELYADYPAVARMAEQLSKRTTPLETFDAADPNRKMALEESPWLLPARGGTDAGLGLTNVLDPRIAKADRDASLAKLRKAQTSIGAFPWWPGGPPSPFMTLYILHGLAKATEFGVEVPEEMVQRGWRYLAGYLRSDLREMMRKDCCWEFLTFLNYVASCYPDPSWVADAITAAERREILDFSFKHWKQHSPFLKGYLTLTLKRMGRPKDARLVWDSVMDSARTTQDEGTFWAAEDRSWLWYNDTIETHAFALRTLVEMDPKDPRRDGLVQWILLNKKLNQWKSTRATAEVVYSLVHYLKQEGALGIREDATVKVGGQTVSFVFEPDRYTGKKNQVVVPGEKIDPKTTSTVTVEKESKGFAFASATWHFSTERLPDAERGDFFSVTRRYFRRENTGHEWVLSPLKEGAALSPGDQVEVHLSLRSKHAAEYVHLRDPRAAGLEPENAVSRYRWDLGIGWYEEVRDSGTNFFFEQLPAGEYTFKYRLRANMAGTFRVSPATVQSMYAPEFAAYSAGNVLVVEGER